jgi:hypothetical protein
MVSGVWVTGTLPNFDHRVTTWGVPWVIVGQAA